MLKVIDHPLIKHKLTVMRKKETGTKDFRQNLDEIGGLMVYEITRDLPLKPIEIETPICQYTGYELAKKVVIVPILRAGLGMVNGIQDLIPTAKIAHVGMYRDEETLEPHTYFEKYPKNLEEAITIVVDPMLATGGSSVAAIDMVKKQGATNVKLVCLVGAPEGVKTVEKAHPDVLNMLLQILDDGRLTDSHGRTVNFKNCVIIMTSNIGARLITDKKALGFSGGEEKEQEQAEKKEYEDIKKEVIAEVKKTFRPEFINRVDEIIVFHKLTEKELVKIVDIMLEKIKARLLEKDIKIEVDKSAKDLVIKKGTDTNYGARPLRRAIQTIIEDKLAEEILDGNLKAGDTAKLTAKDDTIQVKIKIKK